MARKQFNDRFFVRPATVADLVAIVLHGRKERSPMSNPFAAFGVKILVSFAFEDDPARLKLSVEAFVDFANRHDLTPTVSEDGRVVSLPADEKHRSALPVLKAMCERVAGEQPTEFYGLAKAAEQIGRHLP